MCSYDRILQVLFINTILWFEENHWETHIYFQNVVRICQKASEGEKLLLSFQEILLTHVWDDLGNIPTIITVNQNPWVSCSNYMVF